MCHAEDIIPLKQRTFLVRYLGDVFPDANVCNFFFLSGFLVARHVGEMNWWRNAIRSRLRTLFPPYVLWCLVYYAFDRLFLHSRTPFAHELASCDGPALLSMCIWHEMRHVFGLGLLTSPCNFPLWYIKTLFYFILVSPILFRFILQSKWSLYLSALSLIAFKVYMNAVHLSIMPYFLFCFHIFGAIAFMSGAFCALHRIDFPERLKHMSPFLPLIIWGAVSLVAFLFIDNVKHSGAILRPINVAVSVFCLTWVAFSAKWNIPRKISQCSFFIYAGHLMALHGMKKSPLIPTSPILTFGFLVCSSLLVCIVAAHAIHLISPRLSSLLSGGRFEK